MTEIAFEPWMIGVAAYPVLQTIAVVRLRGALRVMSLILTVMMLSAVGVSAAAYALEPSNLWQMIMMLATPPSLVLTLGLILLGSVVQPQSGRPAPQARARRVETAAPDAWPEDASMTLSTK